MSHTALPHHSLPTNKHNRTTKCLELSGGVVNYLGSRLQLLRIAAESDAEYSTAVAPYSTYLFLELSTDNQSIINEPGQSNRT